MKCGLSSLMLIMWFLMPQAFATNPVFHYAYEVSRLDGVIKIQNFLEPPSYEYPDDGYRIITIPYLILDRPIDVVQLPGEPYLNRKEKDVKILQILIAGGSLSNVKNDNRVCVMGYLFHKLPGHRHYTRVLISGMDVEKGAICDYL